MKASKIPSILDLAVSIRKQGKIFNPLFSGPPGLGKSEVCQQWVAEQRKTNPEFGFVDLRIAYMEAPDLIGVPTEITGEDGTLRTTTALPGYWPTSGEGLLLLEEPNRGTTGVMNCLMQLLTDRKVHNYTLPEGWIVAACINPENEQYDVNTMDAALKNRFENFPIEYDKAAFVKYMKEQDWDPSVIVFCQSIWKYVIPEKVAAGNSYVSPRTWSKINNSRKAGVEDGIEMEVYQASLGDAIGLVFFKYVSKNRPVMFDDYVDNKKLALRTLQEYSDPKDYKSAQISMTVSSFIKEASRVKPEDLAAVASIIPADQGYVLLKSFGEKTPDLKTYLRDFFTKYPSVKEHLRNEIG